MWKKRIRAYDEARLRLRIATPAQIQRENAAIILDPKRARILTFARYA
jgi:hypothetical protein